MYFQAGEGAKTKLLDKWSKAIGADSKKMKPLSPQYKKAKGSSGVNVRGSKRTGEPKANLNLTGDLWRAIFVNKGSRKNQVSIEVRESEKKKALWNADLRPNMMRLGNERSMRKIAKDIFFKYLTRK